MYVNVEFMATGEARMLAYLTTKTPSVYALTLNGKKSYVS